MLVKHQIECTGCEKESIVVTDEANETPAFCPHCGDNLNDPEPDQQVYE